MLKLTVMRSELTPPIVPRVPEGGARGDVVGYYDEFWVRWERVCEECCGGWPDVEGVRSGEEGYGEGEGAAIEVDGGGEGGVSRYWAGGELGEAGEEGGFAAVGRAEEEDVDWGWRGAGGFKCGCGGVSEGWGRSW